MAIRINTNVSSLRRSPMRKTMNLEDLDPAWAWDAYSPSDSQPWNLRRANHLHRRAGFAATPNELQDTVDGDVESAVDGLMKGGDTTAFDAELDALTAAVSPRREIDSLVSWWIYRMIHSPHPLLEKTTLFWHGHFATSAAKVTNARLMLEQNEILRTNALGRFEPMVQAISRDPAMLIYLDSTDNRKTHPNENYSRELMELFCLGVGNYTEEDIQELARCFTGWEVRRERFRFNRYQHDFGVKRFLGTEGEFDGDQAVKVVLAQDAAPRFIAGKLIRYFMTDDPHVPQELIQPLAQQLRDTDFDLGAAVRSILTCNWFYSDHCIGRKVRSPIELSIGTLRLFTASTNLFELAQSLEDLGQKPFFPPNVKGWDGGKDWINSSTMLGRTNLIYRLVHQSGVKYGDGSLSDWCANHGLRGARDSVKFLAEHMLMVDMPESVESRLADLYRSQSGGREEKLRSVVVAIGSLPEFQLN